MIKVLVVDDEPVQLRLTEEIATKAGFTTLTASGGQEALSLLRTDPTIGAMVLDLIMPEIDGMAVLETMQREEIGVPVIVQTAHSSLETVVSAMRQGASDYFVKPVAPERLVVSLQNALRLDQLETCVRTDRAKRDGTLAIKDIVTASPVMDRVIELSGKAAKSAIPVLIEGETGVGKELVARAIQGSGERASKPFVTVNCGAIPENLIESTLFGHVKGAFTGATTDHTGKFAEAHGGTLFLDEVGELPPAAQVKLLRALQDGEIEPVGGAKPQKVNVRVISATNRRLLSMAQEGTFREDLYYRLNVFPIYVPPLRERLEDIGALCAHFLTRFSAEARRRINGISEEALALLKSYSWPGNIRQLENAVFRAVVLAENADLKPADFPQILAHMSGRDTVVRAAAQSTGPDTPTHIDDLRAQASPVSVAKPAMDRFLTADGRILPINHLERDLIAYAIDHFDGHMSKVARALGIGRSTLYRKIKEYELDGETAQTAA